MRLATWLLLLLFAGCSFGDRSTDTSANALRVTRTNGLEVDFPGGIRAWCGPSRGENTEELTGPPALYVLGGEGPAEDEQDPASFWIFVGRVDALERSERTELRHEGDDVTLFALDGPAGNELSSAVEDADGTVTVEEWSCDEGDRVRLAVDATLGSELAEMPSARAEGDVETTIGEPPAWAD